MKRFRYSKSASAPAGSAFTLLEMLVVVTIVGVLAGGMAVALTGRHERRALGLAAEDVMSAVGFAAAQSRLTGQEHGVVILPKGNGIYVDRADGQDVAGQAGRDHNFAGGVQVAELRDLSGHRVSMVDRLALGPGGFAGRIILQAPSGGQWAIEVLESGQAYVQELK